MSRVEDLKAEVRARWGEQPAAELCARIIDYVARLLPDQAEMLTFETLCQATGKEAPDNDLVTAIAILANSRIDALDAHALLVDDDDNTHDIDADELADARESGELIHPVTGRPVDDFETHIVPYFVPTQRFREFAM